MIVTIVVVAAFKSSVALTNAYGYVVLFPRIFVDLLMKCSFSVATVMLSTTILIAVQMRYVKHLPVIIGVGYFVIFGFFDGVFLFYERFIFGCILWM